MSYSPVSSEVIKLWARFENPATQKYWDDFVVGSDSEKVCIQSMGRAPHCDPKVLHPPGACWACDLYPAWQDARLIQGINFTGGRVPDKLLCPSEIERPLEAIEKWGGNVATKGPDEPGPGSPEQG